MNMQLVTPKATKILEDYDFLLTSGVMMPVTIDKDAGDVINFAPESITITLTSKPSMNDPTQTLPAEDITLYRLHVISYQHRVREVVQLTPEQQFEWNRTFQEMGGNVQ